MKLVEIKEMVEIREDVVAYLYMDDIIKIQQLLNKSNICYDNDSDVISTSMSFKTISSLLLKYRTPKNRKYIDKIFEIILAENSMFKTERYRFDENNSIYEYDESHGAYMFLQVGTQNNVNLLINQNGRFI